MAWRPDSAGINGVYLGRNIVTEAGLALEYCLRKAAPRVRGGGWKDCLLESPRQRKMKAEARACDHTVMVWGAWQL